MATQRQGTDFGILLGLAYQAFVVELRDDLERAGLDGLGRADGYVFRYHDGRWRRLTNSTSSRSRSASWPPASG